MHTNYYIITYKAFIDSDPVTGQVGVVSKTCDYYPNKHKKILRSYYETLNPGKNVVVHLFAKKVSAEKYSEAATGFLLLPQAPGKFALGYEGLNLNPQ